RSDASRRTGAVRPGRRPPAAARGQGRHAVREHAVHAQPGAARRAEDDRADRRLPARRGVRVIPGGFMPGGLPGGRRRRPAQTVPDSGLTGPVDIPEPPQPEQPKDLKSRFNRMWTSVSGTVRGLPKVVRLTWQASPTLTILLALVTLLSGLLPTATAY